MKGESNYENYETTVHHDILYEQVLSSTTPSSVIGCHQQCPVGWLRGSWHKTHPVLRAPPQTPQVVRDTLAAPGPDNDWIHPALRAGAPGGWVEVWMPCWLRCSICAWNETRQRYGECYFSRYDLRIRYIPSNFLAKFQEDRTTMLYFYQQVRYVVVWKACIDLKRYNGFNVCCMCVCRYAATICSSLPRKSVMGWLSSLVAWRLGSGYYQIHTSVSVFFCYGKKTACSFVVLQEILQRHESKRTGEKVQLWAVRVSQCLLICVQSTTSDNISSNTCIKFREKLSSWSEDIFHTEVLAPIFCPPPVATSLVLAVRLIKTHMFPNGPHHLEQGWANVCAQGPHFNLKLDGWNH